MIDGLFCVAGLPLLTPLPPFGILFFFLPLPGLPDDLVGGVVYA